MGAALHAWLAAKHEVAQVMARVHAEAEPRTPEAKAAGIAAFDRLDAALAQCERLMPNGSEPTPSRLWDDLCEYWGAGKPDRSLN